MDEFSKEQKQKDGIILLVAACSWIMLVICGGDFIEKLFKTAWHTDKNKYASIATGKQA